MSLFARSLRNKYKIYFSEVVVLLSYETNIKYKRTRSTLICLDVGKKLCELGLALVRCIKRDEYRHDSHLYEM